MATTGRLKQIRNGHRTYTDKLMDQMEKKMKDKLKDSRAYDEVKIELAKLKKKMADIEKVDAEILETITEDAEIIDEIENATAFTEKMVTVITKAELAIQYFDDKGKNPSSGVTKVEQKSSGGSGVTAEKDSTIQMKLPPIQVGEYNGSLLTWSLFWDKFDVAIHSRKDLSDIQKYTYLKSYLVGDAKRAIQGVTYDKDNYTKAIEVLTERFGNKQLRVSAHMKELQTIKGVGSINDVPGMRRMYDCLETNITSLKVLGVDVSTYGSLLISVIYERIPEEIRIKISLEFGNGDWKLDTALEVFKTELEARERSSAISGVSNEEWNEDSFSTAHSLQISTSRYGNNTFSSHGNNSHNGDRRFNGRGGNFHGGGPSRGGGSRGGPFRGGNFRGGNYRGGGSVQGRMQNQQNEGNWRDGDRAVVCVFCKGSHSSHRCLKVTNVGARSDIIKRENRCFICLKLNHKSRDCRLKFYSCVNCNQRHNIALCSQNNPPSQVLGCVAQAEATEVMQNITRPEVTEVLQNVAQAADPNVTEGLTSLEASITNIIENATVTSETSSEEVLLQCALGVVSHPNKLEFLESRREGVCILFDGCSQRTYIKDDLYLQLDLPIIRHEKLILKTFGEKQGTLKSLMVVQLCIEGKDNSEVYIEALVVPFICSRLKVPPVERIVERYDNFQSLDLAESPTPDHDVELLIGMNFYYSVVTGGVRRGLPGHPTAIDSILGWMICDTQFSPVGGREAIIQLISVEEDLVCSTVEDLGVKAELQKFWEDEPVVEAEESNVWRNFEETIQFNGARYVVKLPFKDPTEFIADHYKIALKRLQSLHVNVLEPNLELKEQYYAVFEQWENENIIEKVNDQGVPGKVCYLPHRPIVRADKETTKIRPIFDASAHERGGKSLNQYLHTGPTLLCQIVDILLRSCFKRNIVIADIRQAFLNIEISEDHKDFLRFLLLDKDDHSRVQMYRFNRGVFGVNSLPFILCATIIHHMNEVKARNPDLTALVDQFLRDLYMDDETTGFETIEEGKQFYEFAKSAMASAGLDLRKWDSNSPELREYMNCEEDKDIKKILGILWNRRDEFMFVFSELVAEALKLEVTKTNVLSFGSKLFDPVGWIAPLIMVARLYFQRICKGKFGWNDVVGPELQKGWLKYLQSLAEIKCIRISRYMFSSIIDVVESVELHGYCDSSEHAYCAVIYAVASSADGHTTSRIVASRCKVAPIRKTSIPRLELLSCVLLAELMVKVSKTVQDVTVVSKKHYWSDSEVALTWIKSDEKTAKWTPWVERRAKKVRKKTEASSWGYIHTSINPADIGTREASAMKIHENDLWWHSPSLPHNNPPKSRVKTHPEVEKEKAVTTLLVDLDP